MFNRLIILRIWWTHGGVAPDPARYALRVEGWEDRYSDTLDPSDPERAVTDILLYGDSAYCMEARDRVLRDLAPLIARFEERPYTPETRTFTLSTPCAIQERVQARLSEALECLGGEVVQDWYTPAPTPPRGQLVRPERRLSYAVVRIPTSEVDHVLGYVGWDHVRSEVWP